MKLFSRGCTPDFRRGEEPAFDCEAGDGFIGFLENSQSFQALRVLGEGFWLDRSAQNPHRRRDSPLAVIAKPRNGGFTAGRLCRRYGRGVAISTLNIVKAMAITYSPFRSRSTRKAGTRPASPSIIQSIRNISGLRGSRQRTAADRSVIAFPRNLLPEGSGRP